MPDMMAQEMRQRPLMLLGTPIVTGVRRMAVNALLLDGIFDEPYE